MRAASGGLSSSAFSGCHLHRTVDSGNQRKPSGREMQILATGNQSILTIKMVRMREIKEMGRKVGVSAAAAVCVY